MLVATKNGSYSIYDYVTLSNWFYFFSENELIEQSPADIKQLLDEGLTKAKEKKEIDHKRIANLLHFGQERPESAKMMEKVSEIHHETIRNRNIDLGREIIENLNKMTPMK